MIQSKIGRDLTGTTIHENDQEAGEHHGQRIELGQERPFCLSYI